jgi:hypothetical protein
LASPYVPKSTSATLVGSGNLYRTDTPRNGDGFIGLGRPSLAEKGNLSTSFSGMFEALFQELANLRDAWNDITISPGKDSTTLAQLRRARTKSYQLTSELAELAQVSAVGVDGLISALVALREQIVSDPPGSKVETTVLAYWPSEETQWGSEGPITGQLSSRVTSSDETLDIYDQVLYTTGTPTITLPSEGPYLAGKWYFVKHVSVTGPCTVKTFDGSDIDYQGDTITLNYLDSVRLIYDDYDLSWFII